MALSGGTPVGDVSPLAGLTGLQSLYLHGTQVRDVSPLAKLTAWLDLPGTLTALQMNAPPKNSE